MVFWLIRLEHWSHFLQWGPLESIYLLPSGRENLPASGQILSPWLGDIVDLGIELSYRHASLCSLAGRYDNPVCTWLHVLSLSRVHFQVGSWRALVVISLNKHSLCVCRVKKATRPSACRGEEGVAGWLRFLLHVQDLHQRLPESKTGNKPPNISIWLCRCVSWRKMEWGGI